MPPLHPTAAFPTTAHSNIKAAHHGAPYDLFLILPFVALKFHAASATRAALRQCYADLFIEAPGNGAAGSASVGATGFPAWKLRVGFRLPTRVGRSLALARPQRRFQFLAQALDFLLQALVLLLQPFDLPLDSVNFLPGNNLDGVRWLSTVGRALTCLHPPYDSLTTGICPAESSRGSICAASGW